MSSTNNKTVVNQTRQLCECKDENLEHYILNLFYLEYIRNPIIRLIDQEVVSLLGKSCFQEIPDHEKLCIILDCTRILLDQSSSKH